MRRVIIVFYSERTAVVDTSTLDYKVGMCGGKCMMSVESSLVVARPSIERSRRNDHDHQDATDASECVSLGVPPLVAMFGP